MDQSAVVVDDIAVFTVAVAVAVGDIADVVIFVDVVIEP